MTRRQQATFFLKFLTVVMVFAITLSWCTDSEAKRMQREDTYNREWCTGAGGSAEVRLQDRTRVDCLTQERAVEADFADKWYEAVGQAIHYAILTERQPAVLLIIELKDQCRYLDALVRAVIHTRVMIGDKMRPVGIDIFTTGPGARFC